MFSDACCPQKMKREIPQYFVRAVLLVLTALAIAVPLRSQVTGTISGYVKDPSGAFASGAKVTATETQRNIPTVTQTSAEGFYNFIALEPGAYTLRVEETGFQTYVRGGLDLTV